VGGTQGVPPRFLFLSPRGVATSTMRRRRVLPSTVLRYVLYEMWPRFETWVLQKLNGKRVARLLRERAGEEGL